MFSKEEEYHLPINYTRPSKLQCAVACFKRLTNNLKFRCCSMFQPLVLEHHDFPCVTFRRVAVSLRGPGQSPVLPFVCCVGSLRSDGRCGIGVVAGLAEPSSWRTGVVLVVADVVL